MGTAISAYVDNHPRDLYISTEFTVGLCPRRVGHTSVMLRDVNSNLTSNVIRVLIYTSQKWYDIGQVIGWIYFVAWSLSFYPQCYENWKRKSVVGLSFDFLSFNVLAFACYSLFNVGLYAIPSIQREYFKEWCASCSVNPVQLNDAVFSVHALVICIFTAGQCFIYDRGDQRISRVMKVILVVTLLFIITSTILAACDIFSWLQYLYLFSYIKLGTIVKFIPQGYYNYVRKSTVGWSIGNIILDFTGGNFSILQMCILSYSSSDWNSMFQNPTKFGIGFLSCCFDVFFMMQHYMFYRKSRLQRI